MTDIPRNLQGVLWSRDIKKIDLKKDSAYVINQVLAYGTFEHLKWLFKTYSQKIIIKTFLTKPIKTYSAPSFNFIKTILFPDIDLREDRYVQNLPRNI